MAEPTCVMHVFSHASVISNEATEGNSVYDLEESVSLGRFMSESLSWEKWSTFSRNRYVEEAEQFSKPGSVKQKKAYFEAQFKRMAAFKAAALPEQAEVHQLQETRLSYHEHDRIDGQDQLVSKIIQETDREGTANEHNPEFKEHNDGYTHLCGQEEMVSSIPLSKTDQIKVDKEADNSGFAADQKEYNPSVGGNPLSIEVLQGADQPPQEEPKEHLMDAQKQNPSTEMETGLGEMKESLMKRPSIGQQTCLPATLKSKRSPALSSYMSSIEAENSPISSTIPTKPVAKPPAVHPGKENSWTPVGRKSWADDSDKKRTPLRVSFNREFNRLISPVIKKIGGSLNVSKKDCSTPLKTPLKVSADGKEMGPRSGRRRARAIFDSSGCGSKAAGPRWQFLSEGGAKSPCSGEKKTTISTVPKVFGLGGDKVPKRKEKLEEKFNSKATENLQHQSKLKEKPKEQGKLRHSFCFGAYLSSDSSREREILAISKQKAFCIAK